MMEVHIEIPLLIGNLLLIPGDYQVRIEEHNRKIWLSNPVNVYEIIATPRASKMQVSTSSVQLRQVVGKSYWLLIVRTPPATEWVVSLPEQKS